MIRVLLACVGLFVLSATAASAQLPELARFVDPISTYSARLSPNGRYVAFVRRRDDRNLIVVADIERRTQAGVQQIADDVGRYMWVEWKNDDRLVIGVEMLLTREGETPTGSFIRSDDSETRFARVVALNRDGGGFRQMFEGQMYRAAGGENALLDILPNDPSNVLLMAWDRSGGGVWRADVNTGRAEKIADGTDLTQAYFTDGSGYPVLRQDVLRDRSGYRIYRRASGAREWTIEREVRRVAAATNSPDFRAIGSGPSANQVYVLARPETADLSGLYLFDTSSGQLGEPLQRSEDADVALPWVDARTRSLIATCVEAQRLACRARDPALQRYIGAVSQFFDRQANVTLIDISADGATWLLEVQGPLEAGGYYIFDRNALSVTPVASIYPNLDRSVLSPTQVVSYRARDGVELWAYVTQRAGGAGPRPMVVLPHGGPEARDFYGYDSFVQFLASRGYVVLQPNFRGSLGFGRAFGDAGRGQWGGRMQDDITDAVRHMIGAGVVDAQRICIVGASYGGYAALAGASLTPELYRCAISIAGVSDLATFLQTQRGGAGGAGAADYQYWLRSIGSADGAALAAVSPRAQAAQVMAPVLLIHGEQDDIVEPLQSSLMRDALRRAGKNVRYVTIPEEGHIGDDWSREHRVTLFSETEAFLAEHLTH